MDIAPVGAGSATEAEHLESGETDYFWIECKATPNDGYEFDHFSWNEHVWWVDRNGQTHDEGIHESIAGGNPTGEWESPHHGSYNIPAYGTWHHAISGLTAHFKAKSKVNLIVTTDPQGAGTTTGSGEYPENATVEISAKPKCSPWKFDHWEIVKSDVQGRTETVTELENPHSLVLSKYQDFSATAYFKHTDSGNPYYDSSTDKLICADSGEMLYDGDNDH